MGVEYNFGCKMETLGYVNYANLLVYWYYPDLGMALGSIGIRIQGVKKNNGTPMIRNKSAINGDDKYK